ncbi:MAG: PLP-dependent aminotransferase family protein [Acidimicrobiales bacterium]
MSDVRAHEAGLAALLSAARTQPAAMSAGLVAPVAIDAIFFGGGLPDPAMHPTDAMTRLLTELLAAPQGQLLGYCHGAGDDELRRAIAQQFSAREDSELSPDQIVVTNGSSGALSLLAVALIDPGDVVLCEALTYPGVLATFRQMGARIVPVPVDGDGICPGELASILTRLRGERARVKFLYTIATCQSPTGTVLSEQRRREIIEIADRFDMLIVQDATYADIRFDQPFPREMITLAPHRTVHVASFSKTLAPGLRMGWVAGPPAIIDVLAQMRTDLGTSRLVQRMVARLITDGDFDHHLREVNAWYRQKRDVVLEALSASCAAHATWSVPAGGFFVWLVLDRGDLGAVEAAGAQHGVGFFGAPYFNAGGTPVAGIRLAYGELDRSELAEGIHRLGRAIAAVA